MFFDKPRKVHLFPSTQTPRPPSNSRNPPSDSGFFKSFLIPDLYKVKPPNNDPLSSSRLSTESSQNIQELINRADVFLKADDIKRSAEYYQEGSFIIFPA